jgi:hypothetical protein
MNAPLFGAPLTALHVTTGGLCRWKAINKVGRHVGLDFYDLLIEGHYTCSAGHFPKKWAVTGDPVSGASVVRKTYRMQFSHARPHQLAKFSFTGCDSGDSRNFQVAI